MEVRTDARRYVDFVYEPEDIFEVRVKEEGTSFASSFYIQPHERENFFEAHLPIHESRRAHVWVGVGPRQEVGNTNPKLNRVLWCDFDSTIQTAEAAKEAIATARIPPASMLVCSGNGYHAYWKLDVPLEPEEARGYSKGIHRALPTDATHDPTRVMRLPGTPNWKTDPPTQCTIEEFGGQVYSATQFPRIEMEITTQVSERPAKLLTQEEVDRFVPAYVEGVRHHLGLAIIGFLRKDRGFNRREALEAMRSIHTSAGFDWPDEGQIKNVSDTYSKPFSQVMGRSGLTEYGIQPPEDRSFAFAIPKVKRPAIGIIDFTEDIEVQEFWIDGLVGPGLTTLWAAPPKAGKSFCVMQLGYHLSRGEDLWGMHVPEPKSVLYFQGELSRGMVYARAMSMFGRGNIPPASQYAMTDKPEETITLNETPEVLLDIAAHYDVIIIDPLSAFNGNDENSYTSVRETLGIFDSLKAQGKAVILVHHTRKLDTDRQGNTVIPTAFDVRGSGLWVSDADSIVVQQKLESGDVRLHFTLRAAPDKDPLTLYRMSSGLFSNDREQYLAELERTGLKYNFH